MLPFTAQKSQCKKG